MENPGIKIKVHASAEEVERRRAFESLFTDCPIPLDERLANLGLFIKRQNLSRILFMNDLYRQIVGVHGIILEFGVRWGQNLALFESFRGIYEPFNHNRRIVGFDTWEGFPSVNAKDGTSEVAAVGAYATTRGYEQYLDAVLAYHEQESPIAHITKYELVKGDATVQIRKYLKGHPETIIAMAYFDLDIYEPTKACLEAIRPHLSRGSVIGFDELNVSIFPGETLAMREVLGAGCCIQRSPYSGASSYVVME